MGVVGLGAVAEETCSSLLAPGHIGRRAQSPRPQLGREATATPPQTKKKKRPHWTRIRHFRSGELNSDFLPQSITQVSSPYPPSASDERTHCFSAPHRNELVVFFCFFGCVFFLLLSIFFRHEFGAAENASLILVWGELFCLLIRSIYNIPCRVSKERLAISVNIHMIGIS